MPRGEVLKSLFLRAACIDADGIFDLLKCPVLHPFNIMSEVRVVSAVASQQESPGFDS